MSKLVLRGNLAFSKRNRRPFMSCGHFADSELSRIGDRAFSPPLVACGQCLCVERVFLIKIVGTSDSIPSPFDGKYLKEYDPSRPGVDPNGEPTIAHVVVTDDPAEAMHFETGHAALEKWREAYGTRADGKPYRPLTAFSVEID